MQSPSIPPTSDDFAIVEYLMQMQLDAPQFKITEMKDISVRHQVNVFNNYVKKMKNANVVDAFVLLNTIQQPLSDIASHGLRIPANTGFKFQLNHLELPPGEETYEALHLIIALGTVINYQNFDSDLDEIEYLTAIPTADDLKGHDSIRIGDENLYYVFNAAQIKTAHYITFKGGENLIHDHHIINRCGVCGKDNATVWCQSDSIKLCAECDKKTHNVNPLFQSHVRVPLREGLPYTQMCQFHPQQKVSYYCPKCHLAVCVDCKINGNHAHGDYAKHKLIPFAQAYNDAHATVQARNTTYITRQKIIEEGIQAAEDRLQEILDNADAVEAEINRIAAAAIASMKKQAAERANIVKSAKAELERKLYELNKQKEFIKTHDETSEPVDFLQYFACSKELEKEILNMKDLPEPLTVHGDLLVYGKLDVDGPRKKGGDTDDEDGEANSNEFAERDINYSVHSYVSTTNDVSLSQPPTTMPLERAPKFTKLSKLAARKEEKMKTMNVSLNFTPFASSEVLTDDDDKRMIYLTLPFKGVPETHLMFSTTRDGRNIGKMHKMIDGKGITLVLVKANGFAFGGFAAVKWNSDGVPFGDQSSCFLFSLMNNALIPARGQSEEQCKLFATEDTLTFGKEDLKLAENFDRCSSQIENSYGVGLVYGGERSKTFLAGSNQFAADVVEVWGFFSSE